MVIVTKLFTTFLGEIYTKMMYTICFVIFITLPSCIRTDNPQWVDPHEMSVSNTYASMLIKELEVKENAKDCPHIHFTLEYYKRLISFILNSAAFDGKSSSYKGHWKLDISISDYKFLSHFVQVSSDEDSAVLRRVDQIMNRILARSRLEDFTEFLITWSDYIYFGFYNRTTGIILSCMFLLFISYKLLRSNFTLWSVTKYLIFIGWVFDFAFTWIKLLQDAEINKMADKIRYKAVPVYCDPDQMSFWKYLWYTISTNEECREYHHVVYKDIFWTVAPLQVLSHQVGIAIYTPALHIGKAIGLFSSGILHTLPWGVNIILLPSLLLFTVLIIGILLSFATETSFQLNLFHLLNFNFGNRQRAAVGDVLSGRNLTALMNVLHRNMIEDVRPNTTNPSNTENCTCRETIKEKEEQEEVNSAEKVEDVSIPENVSDNRERNDGSGDQ